MITRKEIIGIIDKWFKPLTEKDDVKNSARYSHKPLKAEWVIDRMDGSGYSVDLIIDIDPDTCEIITYRICQYVSRIGTKGSAFDYTFITIDPKLEEISFDINAPWEVFPVSKEYSHKLFDMLGEKLSFGVDYKICRTNPCKQFTYDPGENEVIYEFNIELIMFDTDDFTYKISIQSIHDLYLIKTKKPYLVRTKRPINQKDFEKVCIDIYQKYIKGGNE